MVKKNIFAIANSQSRPTKPKNITKPSTKGATTQKRSQKNPTKKPTTQKVVVEKCTCPVCKKKFDKTIEHKYLINNQYTCGWDCFTKYVKEHPPKPKIKRERKSDS